MDKPIVQETEQGQVIEPAEEQQAPAMPAEEQKPTEATGELPEATSDRTRIEFEKLKAHNKELSQKLNQYESNQYGNNVFDSLYGQKAQTPTVPPTVPMRQEQETVQDFVDSNGYVDPEVLKRSLSEANSRAARAEVEAKNTREYLRSLEEKRQVKEAHEKYPWLNPSNKDQFDPVGYELTRDRLVRNMWEGREQSLAEVAEDVMKFRTPMAKPEEIKEKAVNEYKEKQVTKAQASAVQSGKGQPREEFTRIDELRERTRLGDERALDERLKNI
jgi:hypothetical protein